MNEMLQSMMGLRCKDFAMIAADQITTQSIIVMQDDVDKLYSLADKLVMGVTGDPGEATQLSQFVAKNIDLYRIKNGYDPSMEAVVHFTRKNMADSLRTTNRYNVNMLIAGYDDVTGGLLYSLDPMATCVPMEYAAHGYGGMIIVSILDHYYYPTMKESEAYETIQLCVRQIHHRLFLNQPNFMVKVINRQGTTTLPPICPQTFMS